jgi:hypothetical protein
VCAGVGGGKISMVVKSGTRFPPSTNTLAVECGKISAFSNSNFHIQHFAEEKESLKLLIFLRCEKLSSMRISREVGQLKESDPNCPQPAMTLAIS